MKHRALYAIIAALFIPLVLSAKAAAETIYWVGAGPAGNQYNWSTETMAQRVPTADDDVVFSGQYSLDDCVWDIATPVKSITVEPDYLRMIVTALPSGIHVTNLVQLHGGRFDLSAGRLYIDGSLYVMDSQPFFSSSATICMQGGVPGTIQLTAPLEIPDMIVDKPGTTLTCMSNGVNQLTVTASLTMNRGSLVLADGSTLRARYLAVPAGATLDLRGTIGKTLYADMINLQGTFLSNSSAQTISYYSAGVPLSFIAQPGSQVDITGLSLNNGQLRFNGPAGIVNLKNITFNTTSAITALQIDALSPGNYVFDRCVFTGSQGKNIEVPPALTRPGTSIAMTNASGAAAGSAYEQDPNGVVFWSTPTVTGLAPVSRSSAAVDWQWTNNPDADSYRVCQASSGAVLANLPAGTTHFLNAGLTPNTTFTVTLSAYNPLGTSTVTLTCVTPANAPFSGGATTLGSTALKADWDPSGNPPDTEYFVRCSTDATYFAHASSSPWTTVTSWPFDHLISGATYYFQAKARNRALVETPFVAIGAAKSGFDLPGNFTGTALSTGSIKWSWTNPNTGESGYRLNDATGTVIANLPAGTTEYVESGLFDNARCARTVTAYFVAGDSATTAAVARYTLAKLPEPATVTVSTATEHLLTMSWQRGRESSCRVDVSTEPGGPTVTSRAVFGTASVNLGGLLPATTYYLTLTAYNGEGVEAAGSVTRSACTLPLAAAIGNPASAPYDISANRTSGGVTLPVKVEVPQGTVSREIYIDINLDPLSSPREADPARIAAANAAMTNGERCLTDTITEFNMYSSTGDHITGGFSRDVTIRLPFRDEDNDGFVDGLVPQAKVSALRMYTLNEATGRWEPISCTIDTTNHQVVALVRHFSVYTLGLGRAASRTLGGLKVYPNPFTPGSRANGIAFAGLTARATIRIYTVAGELVFEATDDSGTGTYNWAAVNSAGEKLASGVYIYLITNPDGGEKVKGKLAIQR